MPKGKIFARRKNMKVIKATYFTLAVIAASMMFAGSETVNAQAVNPTVRIVLPERFRILTGQFFDLRIEVENIADSTAQMRVVVEDENGEREQLNVNGETEIN